MSDRVDGADQRSDGQVGGRADGQTTSQAGDYDEEGIRRRAYERYLERNGADGDADADWFAAELDMRRRRLSAN